MDYDKLRRNIKDYYGTAMFSGSPMAIIELSKVERMSNEELVKLAKKLKIDLSKY